MKSRVFGVALAGLLAIGLAGCSAPATKASPSPTPPFASADAAYKAAEATYRGYVDALNQVDLDDPKTFEPVYGWLLGKALETEKAELTGMAAKRWTLGGRAEVASEVPTKTEDSDPSWGDITLAVCLDVSDVTVTDARGTSVVSASRPSEQAVLVQLSRDAGTSTGMKITRMQSRVGKPACGK